MWRIGRASGAVAAIVAIAGAAAAVSLARPAGAQTEPMSFAPIVRDASFPTNVAFASDGRAFFTEKDTGAIRILSPTGRVLPRPFTTLPVTPGAETGLLGLALHPDFDREPWVYAYFSDRRDGRNHLVRIRADGDVGGPPENLLTLLPTVNGYHNGGDLVFAPDGTLFVAVGEGHVAERAQDRSSLGGKILRVNDDGSVPPDDPLPGSPVYALGIRNSFGLCIDRDGALWETENGPSAWDEVNRIEAAGNYGWPAHLGPGDAEGFTAPAFAWRNVVVPTGCLAEADGSLLVGDFHGDLHRITFAPGAAPRDEIVASFPQGITDIERTATGRLFVTTANGIYVRTATGSGGPRLTPAGIVVFVGLLALLYLARRRLDRR
jgi:glucose/arabinose dehydrogenase